MTNYVHATYHFLIYFVIDLWGSKRKLTKFNCVIVILIFSVTSYISCTVGCPYDGHVNPKQVAKVYIPAQILFTFSQGCHLVILRHNPSSLIQKSVLCFFLFICFLMSLTKEILTNLIPLKRYYRAIYLIYISVQIFKENVKKNEDGKKKLFYWKLL